MKRVQNLRELKTLLRRGKRDFAIALGGRLVSRKHITRDADGSYSVFHGIDGSTEHVMTLDGLLRNTNIGRALRHGAFYVEA